MTTAEARSGWTGTDWAGLYEAYAPDLARYLRRLVRNAEQATDLAHETFVRAMRADRQPERESEFRPWLYRIASNLAIDQLRRPRVFGLNAVFRSAEPPAVEEMDQVRTALRSIPSDQAVALVLAFHEGFSRREIAQILRVSEETVKSRIARGRLNFAAAYRRLERGLAR
jgi:RNA polymerase sigma-70 factor (ECF subfamily)